MSDVREAAISLAEQMRHLSTGDMATLRRLKEVQLAPAFWRFAAHPKHLLIKEQPERWGPIVRALALLTPKGSPEDRHVLHNKKRPLGMALCDGGDPEWPRDDTPRPMLHERRLAQLLSARGDQRTILLTRAIRTLSSHKDPKQGIDVGDVACAFLNPNNPGAIAAPYYHRLDRNYQ